MMRFSCAGCAAVGLLVSDCLHHLRSRDNDAKPKYDSKKQIERFAVHCGLAFVDQRRETQYIAALCSKRILSTLALVNFSGITASLLVDGREFHGMRFDGGRLRLRYGGVRVVVLGQEAKRRQCSRSDISLPGVVSVVIGERISYCRYCASKCRFPIPHFPCSF
jgi:hypothetical protein